MYIISSKFINKKNLEKYGGYAFLLGIFFLPSTLFISSLFLLISAMIGGIINKKNFFTDLWNLPLILFGILITLSAFVHNIFDSKYSEIVDSNLSFVGIGNWIPFFWIFWAFQPFLNSHKKKRNFAKALVAGTFPVLISGFSQYFFNWFGPFQILNELIIWYQKENITGALSGLFSNPNYAGSWLNIVWPFCIALTLDKNQIYLKKAISLVFLISVGLAIFLTYSRSAWSGLLISSSFIILRKKSKLVIFSLLMLSVSFLILVSQFPFYFKNFIPQNIYFELSPEGYDILDVSRLEIFSSAISLVKDNPIFGLGSNAFSSIFSEQSLYWKSHSHNLLLEIALSYGIPSAIILFFSISSILYKSWRFIFSRMKKKNNEFFIEKAIWAATFFFLISQIVDIQYFDGKLSIIFWTLFAGLKTIIDDVEYASVN